MPTDLRPLQQVLEEAAEGAGSVDELAERLANKYDPPPEDWQIDPRDFQAPMPTGQPQGPGGGMPGMAPATQPTQDMSGGGIAQLLAGSAPPGMAQGMPGIPGMPGTPPPSAGASPFMQQGQMPPVNTLARLLGGG